MAFIMAARYKVGPNDFNSFQRLIEGLHGKAKNSPGFISLRILKSRKEADQALVLSEWKESEHFNNFMNAERIQEFKRLGLQKKMVHHEAFEV